MSSHLVSLFIWRCRGIGGFRGRLLEKSGPNMNGFACVETADKQKNCVGWGHTSHGGSASPLLKSVTVKMVGKEECRKAYSANAITDRMICAGTREGGKDACQVVPLILTVIVFISQARVTVAEDWL